MANEKASGSLNAKSYDKGVSNRAQKPKKDKHTAHDKQKGDDRRVVYKAVLANPLRSTWCAVASQCNDDAHRSQASGT